MRVLLTTASALALLAAPALAATTPAPPGGGTSGATTSHSTNSQSAANPSAAPSATGTNTAGNAAATTNSGMASKADQGFAKQASEGNLAEVQAGELAAKKSDNPAVQEFGRWMKTDHTMAEELLKAAASSANMQLPGAPNAVQKREYQDLQKLSGTKFDQKYINGQVTAHQKTIKLFQNEAQSGQDQALKTYAKAMLPALNAHLQEAQALAANMSSRTANGAAGAAATSPAIGSGAKGMHKTTHQ